MKQFVVPEDWNVDWEALDEGEVQFTSFDYGRPDEWSGKESRAIMGRNRLLKKGRWEILEKIDGIRTDNIYCVKDGKLHGDGRPAMIQFLLSDYPIYSWYEDGKRHRDDGLCAYSNPELGEFASYNRGNLHCIRGAASARDDGNEYFLHGFKCPSKEEWEDALAYGITDEPPTKKQLAYLKMKFGTKGAD